MGISESHHVHPDLKSLVLTSDQINALYENSKLFESSRSLSVQEIEPVLSLSPSQCELVGQLFDPSSSGKIDVYELIGGLIIISDSSLETKANLLFQLYDLDHSLSISFDELLVMLTTGMNALCHMTGAPAFSPDHLNEHTHRVFDKVDVNHDNTISIREWVSFITRDIELVQILEKLELITTEDKRPNWGSEESPEVDSDLENETDKKKFKRTAVQEKVKNGEENYFDIVEVGEGDQFGAVKPWEAAVRSSVPTGYRRKAGDDDPPDANLELEYVYGYRSHDVRNNIKYTANGDVLYHTAAIGVALNTSANTQNHFIAHTDDIISFDISPDGTLAATGEIGKSPLLCVWNTETMECLKTFKGVFTKGISIITFSPDGSQIAAMGADDDHCVVIYDINKTTGKSGAMQNVSATGKAGKDNFMDLKFHPTIPNKLIACGVKVYEVLTINSNTITAKKGIGWNKTPNTQQQALVSIGFISGTPVTGAFNGCIFRWNENTLGDAVKVHESSIICLSQRPAGNGIISGGNDGMIHILDERLAKIQSFDIKSAGSLLPKIRSVFEGRNGKILVGTRASEIYEISGAESRIVMKGHYDKELWGLATHPSQTKFATAGQDCLLSIWDSSTKIQINQAKLEAACMTVDYSPNGDLIAVGLESGKILIYNSESLQILHSAHDRKKPISEIKFSPDSSHLAVGAHDALIFIYEVGSFRLLHKMKGHSSAITHIDFSMNGHIIQSNSMSYEILYHDITNGKHLPGGSSEFKDEAWKTWSCIIGWPVQGIWPPCSDGTDVNALNRSPSRRVVATADDFGQVKLFKYPCAVKGSGFNAYRGHSAHVTNCRFLGDKLITTGGGDKAIFQWSFHEEGAEEIQEEPIEQAEEKSVAKKPIKSEIILSWQDEVKTASPTGFSAIPALAKMPDEEIDIFHAFGYNAPRDNLKFLSDGKIIYPASTFGVLLDPSSKIQQYYKLHTGEVTSLALHPNKKLVATGAYSKLKGSKPEIHIWDSETMQNVCSLAGFHTSSIRFLNFSPNGAKLLSVGTDSDHSLAVYDWQNNRLICSTKVDKGLVNGALFVSNTELVIFGPKFIKFFTAASQNCTATKGNSAVKAFEEQYCGVFYNKKLVTGTKQGNLFIWDGKNLERYIKAHDGSVLSLCALEQQLISGGSEGTVKQWDSSFRSLRSFAISQFTSYGIRSIDVNGEGNVLVGTKSSQILNISGWENASVINPGSFEGELKGLAAHPRVASIFATCGGDKALRLWDIDQKSAIASIDSQEPFVSIDWSSNGLFLAAVVASGKLTLFDAGNLPNLSASHLFHKSAGSEATSVKFSPDNEKIALGFAGGDIQIITISGSNLSITSEIKPDISGGIEHLSWSSDSSILAVNTSKAELRFISINSQSSVPFESIKDLEWRNWTCPLGWQSQSAWQEGLKTIAVCSSNNGKLLATSDENQRINLYKYPAVAPKQACKSFKGHSSPASSLRFSADDNYLISIAEQSILIWKTDINEPHEVEEAEEEKSEEPEEITTTEILQKKADKKEKAKAKLEDGNAEEDFFKLEEAGQGDEFMATKPWIGALKAPSDFKRPTRNQKLAPAVDIELEFVHGYRGKDCRNNLLYLPDGRLIYHAAGLGIIYERDSHSQSFFNKHVDDVTAFALSPNKELAATGEVGRRPSIYVWDTSSLMPVAQFKKPIENGVAALAFSPSGGMLVAVSAGDDHNVAVFNLKTGAVICFVKGDREKILTVVFTAESSFVTVGIKHYKAWSLAGGTVTGKKGVFGKNNTNLLSAIAIGADVYTGAGSGEIIKWKGTGAVKAYEVHQKAVDSLWTDTRTIVSGGKDGLVHILDLTLRKLKSFDFNQHGSICPLIRAASISGDGEWLAVGTYGSEIYEVNIRSNDFRRLVVGHYTPSRGRTVTNEVWGLAVLPNRRNYITASDDGTLRLWDIESRSQIHVLKFTENIEIPISAMARCIGVHPSGSMLVVGFKDGSFTIIDLNSWEIITQKKNRKEEISDVKFSPDGEKLAVGSHDNFIDIYTVSDFNRIAICKGHSSYITHFDWSQDSNFLHSNCGAYELLFWDANTGKQITSGATSLRDEHWATWSCVIGWPVQEIYPPYSDGTDVNATDRSKRKFGNNEYYLLATGDDFSTVKVFRYPCIVKGAESALGRGHSSHVTNVKFSVDDRYLFSTGGDDQCVFQWRVIPKA
ncbi:unnamed protein product [Blepharisma stoltei]|uniref:Calmodulin n=1 Tax=Blepharisma stoltei TaxID=1481888 RepID=A0AAU9JL69_9CILI|nr:unnamed protein product [Blepharisma stoltei]